MKIGLLRTALALLLPSTALSPGTARADAPTPFHVAFASGSACSNAEQLSNELLQRTRRLRLARAEERALSFHVAISASSSGFTGTLSVLELDGSETRRDVRGASCDEITSAMAIIGAVLVDPNAGAAPAPEPQIDPPPPPPPAPTLNPPSPQPEPETPREAPTEPEAASPLRVGFGGSVALALEGAIAPQWTPALALALEATLERDAILSPLLSVALQRSFPAHSSTPNGVARFDWSAVRVSACPIRWPARSAPYALRPCAFLELGALDATGEHTQRAATTSVPWTALGSTLRFEYSPIKPLLVALDGGIVLPLRHDSFYFDPKAEATTAFTIPSAAFTARVAIATRIE